MKGDDLSGLPAMAANALRAAGMNTRDEVAAWLHSADRPKLYGLGQAGLDKVREWVAGGGHPQGASRSSGSPMTPDQFTALAELLRLRGGPATDAARLVLVDGLSTPEAAQRAGVSRTAATNAVTRCRRGLGLAGRVVS